MLLYKSKKSLGELTFSPLDNSMNKVETWVWLQKMRKSVRITNHTYFVTIGSLKLHIFCKYICKHENMSQNDLHCWPWGALINLLISDKA